MLVLGKLVSSPFALILLSILLSITASCGKVPVVGKIVDTDTLPERISSAEIVIVGKLVSVEERALIDQDIAYDEFGQAYDHYIYYDLGEIEVEEILKGSFEVEEILKDSYVKDYIYIKYLSFDQTQHPPNDKADCKHFSSYDIWDMGLWLINIDLIREPTFRVNRGNYVPLDRLEDARECLENR